MKVYANFSQEVDVDPLRVIEHLKEKVCGWREWVFEKDGKYYRGWEQSAGCHSINREEEIREEEYEYYKALETVEHFLKTH